MLAAVDGGSEEAVEESPASSRETWGMTRSPVFRRGRETDERSAGLLGAQNAHPEGRGSEVSKFWAKLAVIVASTEKPAPTLPRIA